MSKTKKPSIMDDSSCGSSFVFGEDILRRQTPTDGSRVFVLFRTGDPYGIRTHECMRERHVS